MSEKLNFIKTEIISYRTEVEAEKQRFLESEKNRIEKEKLMLNPVIDLFKEIRDEGLVIYSTKPVIERKEVKLSNGESKTVTNTVSDYTPAKVYSYTPDLDKCIYYTPRSMTCLRFNYSDTGNSYDGPSISYDEVRIEVVEGKLNLISPCRHPTVPSKDNCYSKFEHPLGDHTEFNNDNMAEIIVKGIKEPVHVSNTGSDACNPKGTKAE